MAAESGGKSCLVSRVSMWNRRNGLSNQSHHTCVHPFKRYSDLLLRPNLSLAPTGLFKHMGLLGAIPSHSIMQTTFSLISKVPIVNHSINKSLLIFNLLTIIPYKI